MRFNNYLNEEMYEWEVKKIIEKNCQPFLKDWDKLSEGFLYTGRKAYIENIAKKQVRKDRNPSDTPYEIHLWLDDWFYKKFKIKARSNAIFCTKNDMTANFYGNPFLIFPIGKYTAISSSTIEDLYDEIQDLYFSIFNRDMKKNIDHLDNNEHDLLRKKITEFLEKSNYKKGLQKHNNEYMISCKEYYLVNEDHKDYLYNELEVK